MHIPATRRDTIVIARAVAAPRRAEQARWGEVAEHADRNDRTSSLAVRHHAGGSILATNRQHPVPDKPALLVAGEHALLREGLGGGSLKFYDAC